MRKVLVLILIISVVFVVGCGQKETEVEIYEKVLDLEISKVAKTSRIEVKLISMERVKSYYSDSSREDIEASSGEIFILIEAEIKNIHSENVFVGSSNFYVKDNQNNQYNSEFYVERNGLPYLKELEPNKEINGKVLFEVPWSVSDYKIQYDFILSEV